PASALDIIGRGLGPRGVRWRETPERRPVTPGRPSTMLTRRGFLRAATASALLVPRVGLAQVAPGAIKRGGTLTAAIFADPLTFDPHFTGNLQGRAATRAIHDTLFRVSAQGRLAPGLVESWEQPDDRTFVLRLRANLKFQ